jgi:RNA polymerase sigma-70 factor (ECF subfamily)
MIPHLDLKKLIKDCKKNNFKAQSDLYKLYKDTLYILCLKYCRNKEDAQDNLQDVFIEIFSKIKSYKGKGSFEGWMKRITINKAIDKYKRDKHINIEINNDILRDTNIDSAALEMIPLNDILKHIQDLPTQYRLVFNLFELDNYTHKDISKLLKISINTSKSNLHRAKSILKNKMQKRIFTSSKQMTANEN